MPTLLGLLLIGVAPVRAGPIYAVGASGQGQGTPDFLFVVNPVTGTLVQIGLITDGHEPMGMESLAFSASLGLYGVHDGDLYSINSNTAKAADIGTLGVNVTALVYGPNGTLYGAAGNNLYTINTSTGQASLIGSGIGTGAARSTDRAVTSPEALDFDATGHLYETGGGADPNSLFLVNPVTGESVRVGAVGAIGFGSVQGLAFVNGTMYGFTGQGQEIAIDLTTGAGTLMKNFHLGFGGAAVDPASAPEPAYGLLAALALTWMALHRRGFVQSRDLILQLFERTGEEMIA